MARLTAAEKRRLEIERYLASGGSEDDPLVSALRRRREELAAQEEEARANPNFDGVRGGSASTEPDREEAGGFLSGLVNQAQAGLQRSGASVFLQQADRGAPSDSMIARGLAQPQTAEEQALAEERASNLSRRYLSESQINAGLAKESLDGTRKFVQDNLSVSPTASWMATQGAEGLYDFAGSPASSASVIPGIGGVIAGADSYNQEYLAARNAGLSIEEAERIAGAKATNETVLGSLPGGKLLRNIPGVGRFIPQLSDELDTVTKKLLVRVPQTALGEGANEVITAWSAMGIDSLVAQNADSDAVREHAKSQLPKDVSEFFDATWRNFRGGLIGGTVIGSPVEGIQIFSESGKLAAERLQNEKLSAARTAAAQPTVQPQAEQDVAQTNKVEQPLSQEMRQYANRRYELLKQRLQTESDKVQELQSKIPSQDEINERVQLSEGQVSPDDLADPFSIEQLQRARESRENIIKAMGDLETIFQRDDAILNTQQQEAIKIDQRKEAVDAERKGAQKALIDRQKSEVAAIKRKHTAAEKSQRAKLVAASQSVPVDQRETYIAEGMADWREANNLEQKVAEAQIRFAQPTAATAAPVASTTTSPAPSTQQEETFDPNILTGMLGEARAKGLAQEGETTDTGVRAADVHTALRARTRGANVATRLQTNDQLMIVDDPSQIPTGAAPAGTAGWYDGKRTYVVANALNPDNIVGDLLSIAAHEVKHGADMAKGDGLVATMGEFVGEVANSRINKKIEALAAQGDPVAVEAKRLATEGSTDDTYRLELPAYFINEARRSRADAGRVGSVVRDVVSAVRTAAKGVIGNTDVNLADVAYLSDKLLTEAALSKQSLESETDIVGQAMIAGKKSKLFDEFKKRGLTYKSVDGNEKFVTSDADFIPKDEIPWDYIDTEDGVLVTDAFDHEILEKQYPKFGNVKIKVDGTLQGKSGYWDVDSQTISVSPAITDARDIDALHEVVIHELQHFVQDQEGHSRGANLTMFMSPEAKRVEDNLATSVVALEQLADVFNHKTALDSLTANNPNGRDHITIAKEGRRKGALTLRSFLNEVSVALDMGPQTTRIKDMQDRINRLMVSEANLRKESRKNNQTAHELYMQALGELEAYWTQENRDVTQEELETAPESEEAIRAETGLAISPEDAILVDTEGRVQDRPSGKPIKLAQKAKPVPAKRTKERGKFKTAMMRLLLPDQGFGETLNKIRQNAAQLPASLAVEGEQLQYQVQRALKDAGRLTGNTEEQVRADVAATLEKVSGMDRATRLSTLAALDRKYPGQNLGFHLNRLRDYKWQLAQELITLRTRDKSPLSAKEKAIYEKIIANAETWTTRAYQSTVGGRNNQYAENFLKRAEDDPNSKEGQRKKAAVELLIARDLQMPEGKTMDDLTDIEVENLFRAWDLGSVRKVKAGGESRAEMVKRLEFLSTASQEMYEMKANEIIEDLIGKNKDKTNVAKQYRGAQQNRTVLEARTDIPVELREVMGEITDPFLKEAISVARLTQLVGQTTALTEVYEQDNMWQDVKGGEYQYLLESPSFGPLDGKYVTKDVYDFLGTYVAYANDFDTALKEAMTQPDFIMQAVVGKGLPYLRSIGKAYKFTNIVTNTFAMMANFVGSPLMVAMNAVNPKHIKPAIMDTFALVTSRANKNASPERTAKNRELLFAGATDSATVGEFRGAMWQDIKREIERLDEKGGVTPKKVFRMLKEYAGDSKELIAEVYAFMDVWTKVATYYDRKEFLTKYNKAEKLGWTDEKIIRDAGYQAAGTNISWSRALPIAKILEQSIPFITMFLTYKTETFRVVAGSYGQALADYNLAKEAKTPEGKLLAGKQAATRVAGTLAVLGAVVGGTMSHINQDDEDEEKRRKLFPDWEKNKVHVEMGVDEKGVAHYFSANRLDPLGPVNELIVEMLRAESVSDGAAKALKGFITNSRSYTHTAQLITDLAAAVIDKPEYDSYSKSGIVKRAMPELHSFLSRTLSYGDLGENLINTLESTVIPSQFLGWMDPEKLDTDQDMLTKGGLNAAGYKEVVADPDKALKFRTGDYIDGINALKEKKKKLLSRSEGMTAKAVIEDMNEIVAEERELFGDLTESVHAYTGFYKPNTVEGKKQDKGKHTVAEGLDVVKSTKLLTDKKVLNRLRTGEFQSTLLTPKLVDEWFKELSKKVDRRDPEYKAKIKELEAQADLLKKAYPAQESN